MSRVSVNKISDAERTKTVDVLSLITKLARFLPPSATVPTLREDGSALQYGDTYFNSVSQVEFIFKNAGWVAR